VRIGVDRKPIELSPSLQPSSEVVLWCRDGKVQWFEVVCADIAPAVRWPREWIVEGFVHHVRGCEGDVASGLPAITCGLFAMVELGSVDRDGEMNGGVRI